MENIENIRKLLDRFYDGSTNLDEELQLQAFFEKEKVPSDLAADKKLFLSLSSVEKEVEVPNNLDEKILNKLHQAEKSEVKIRRIGLYSLSGLAAGLLIILSVYLGFIREKQFSNTLAQYTVQDPELAYMEAKNALSLISEKWNTGTGELSKLDQVNRGIETVSTINKLSSGSKELNLLGNLKKAENIIIQ